ncbi:MAG: sulfatase [Chloroflexota bacterium]
MSGTRPNLLYLHSDQHDPYITGCYGDPYVQTPHLDRLAAQGVLFTNVYCSSPLCVPSRMSLLTCQYPCDIEVWTNEHILDSGIPTFAHAMSAAGYWPVLIGRMHALGPDQLHGYVERLVGDHGPNYLGGQPVDHGILAGTAGPARVSLENSGPGQSAYQVHDEDVAAAAVDYLNRLGVRKRAGLLGEPFNLSVGFMLPHQPYVARRDDYTRYEGKVPPPRCPEPFSERLHPYLRWWRTRCGIEQVSEAEVMRARTAYYALVTRLDALIGQILDALYANDLAENTIIIILYSSDHGEQLGEHGLWWKQTFYEHAVKVPAILVWPGSMPAGVRCERMLSALDLIATVLDALGAPPLPNGRGRSVLPLLRNPDHPWDATACSELCTDEGWYMRMIRRGNWKLCYYHGHEPQLFDLARDPDELCDRAQDPACREVRTELTQHVLARWDPETIAKRMQAKRADLALLRAWARQTQPPDHYRWTLLPEMNRLET